MGLLDRFRSDVRQAWGDSWPLMATAYLMLPSLGISLLGLLVDPRVIAGAPAWLKLPQALVGKIAPTVETLTAAGIWDPANPGVYNANNWTKLMYGAWSNPNPALVRANCSGSVRLFLRALMRAMTARG